MERIYSNNKIIVDIEKVSIESDIEYKALDIVFSDYIGIESLLPSDYLIKKSNSKSLYSRIIILKVNNREEILSELFKYRGRAIIMSCTMYDLNNAYSVKVQNLKSQMWSNIGTDELAVNNSWWSTETSNYNTIEKNDRNDYHNYYRTKKDIDALTNKPVYKKIKEQKTYNIKYEDRNIHILGNLNSKAKTLINKKTKEIYQGKYHYNMKTKKIMTGSSPNKNSVELIKNKVKTEYRENIGKVKPKKLKRKTIRQNIRQRTGGY